MAFIKEESEDMRIEETFSVKQEDPEKKTDLMLLKEESQELNEMEEKDCDFITGEKYFSCSRTKKSSSPKKAKKKQTNRNFICSYCSKSFSTKVCLKRIHTRAKPYTCKQCGMSFTYKVSLDIHLISHTGERPYTCKQCEKSFSLKGNLKAHMRIHSGEKPFACPHCGKSFTTKGNLEAHMRVHTGEKPFTCSQCGKSFNQKGTLEVHMRFHTGEKPFSIQETSRSSRFSVNATRGQVNTLLKGLPYVPMKGKLYPLPIPHCPRCYLGIDFVPDIPPFGKKTCILVAVNRFSKA
ncbi:gastrula zinc finger protein xLCGF3.1-like [Pseudorasbora parva]|uniref:gastrula zinc finger protein xLCGF3.1-like n=1 Tax=Pseudorasbora parva TaxID=51549 RepID=UPI00351F722C